MSLTNVDFPDPFEPSSAWISPGATSRSTPRRTGTWANAFMTPRATSGEEPATPRVAGVVVVWSSFVWELTGTSSGALAGPVAAEAEQRPHLRRVVQRVGGDVVLRRRRRAVGAEQLDRDLAAVLVLVARLARRLPQGLLVEHAVDLVDRHVAHVGVVEAGVGLLDVAGLDVLQVLLVAQAGDDRDLVPEA